MEPTTCRADALSDTAVHYPRTWTLPYGTTFDLHPVTRRQVVRFVVDAELAELRDTPNHDLATRRVQAGAEELVAIGALTVRSGGQATGNDNDSEQVYRAGPWNWTDVDGERRYLGALLTVTADGTTTYRPDTYGDRLDRHGKARAANGAKGGRPSKLSTALTAAERKRKGRLLAKGMTEADALAAIERDRSTIVLPLTPAEQAKGKRAAAAASI